MPAPKRANTEDYFTQLPDAARPHLEKLRELSLAAAKTAKAREELKWNSPAYSTDTILWMLQSFKNHCSLRFPLQSGGGEVMDAHRAEIEDAGYEAIEGAIKIRYDQPVPAALIKKLLKTRIDGQGKPK